MYSKPFTKLSKDDVTIAGGKGASLGELTQAGISVPPGYVILSNAFEKFLETSDINIEIDAILKTVNIDAMHTVENAAVQIQKLILEEKEIPKEIEEEILSEFKKLDTEFVAVRSSATAEDSAEAAWAGQLDTFLNTTEEVLLLNIRKAWASLFTPRAIFYRFEKGLDQIHISVAVVVQKMVNSESAGIAFSVHPVTEDRNQMIIEAGFGLGEAVVSGQITPDSYVVTKEPRKILDKNVITQEKGLFRKISGGNEWRETKNGIEQVLSDDEILKLSETVLNIESHYGLPQDIEWAKEGSDVYIVQSRPITTLSESTERQPQYEKVYTCDTTIIIQQAWNSELINQAENELGSDYPPGSAVIHYMTDGAIEVWENQQFTDWLIGRILEKNKQDTSFFRNHIKAYKQTLSELAFYWEKDSVETTKELEKVADLIFKGMFGFIIMYFSAYSDETPDAIKKEAREMRDRDVFFDQNDNLLRKSLLAIYPELKSTETTILKAEISNIPPEEERLARMEHMVFIGDEVRETTTLRKYAEQHTNIDFIFETPPVDSGNTIQGTAVFRGNVQGVVRVVRRKEQIGDVQEGDIIVAPMTTPDFLPAMKKAVAIVTDEGGITSHAAIVARELKKPCIIGTKFATQILKDGDLVEVDANKGIVKILESDQVEVETMDKLKPLVTRHYTPFFSDLFMRGYANGKYYKEMYWQPGVVRMGYVDSRYYYGEDLGEFGHTVVKSLGKEDKSLLDLFENIYSYGDNLLADAKKLAKQKFENEKNFFNGLEQIITDFERFSIALIGYTLQDSVTEMLHEITMDDEEVAILSFPDKENIATHEQESLYRIGAEVQKSGIGSYKNLTKDLKKKINSHIETYGWINARGGFIQAWTQEEVFERINSTEGSFREKLDETEETRMINHKASQDLIRKLKLSKHQKDVIKIAKELVFFRTYRTDVINEAGFAIQPLLKKSAEYLGVSHEHILHSRVEEILTKSLPPEETIRARKENYFELVDAPDKIIFTENPEEIIKFSEKYFEEEVIDSEVITGNIAYKGVITGPVRKIKTKEDISRVQKGDVLVTSMTTPNMVPAMEKAAAFVTDEGGITCHAAIIAREMKKPCIIGTKFVTQILKDGDLVEVDANKGVVRILKKHDK